ncbi:AAA family ATPase [Desulfogranum mediterraneum]|uniref:AAA family ATPase n=1 Tax=Desulfogranum mediterraneum TaxID=160661 RepID=UPI00041F9B92|nr:AAA family ATPase [Desulfogranum mediterraneum]
MYLEHFNLNHPPFKEEPDVHIFYPGGQREAICRSLIRDMSGGSPLLKFIGREGSGKTLICRLLAEQIPADYDVVYLDNPIGSFDDLLRIICLDLGMNPSGGHEEVNFAQELHKLVSQRRQAKRKVLIIIDEAEKLFLATLERLVRAICDTEDAQTLRILLAGRPGLDVNLEQLSIFCANVDINAGYTLEPLSEEETGQYLTFRLEEAGLSRHVHEEIFSSEAITKIHGSAQGNMRMINILAEESLQNSCTDKSFMVLLDHVDVEEEPAGPAVHSLFVRMEEQLGFLPGFFRENRLLAGAAGGALVMVVLLIMLLSGDGTDQEEPGQTSGQDSLAIISPAPEERELEPVAEETPPPAAEPVAGSAAGSFAQVAEEAPEQASEQAAEQTEDALAGEVLEEPESGADSSGQASIAEERLENRFEPLDTPTADPAAVVVAPATKAEPVVVTIGPEQKKRAVEPPQPRGSRAAQSLVVPPVVVQPPQDQPVNGRDGSLLFKERRRASANWLAEAYRGSYTIQLMMLTSTQAEQNLTRMLTQDAYFAIKDQLYILRKKTTPPTLFVYYGIYPTMEEARQVRNTMPVFLRKHHPYAVAIAAALKKSED